MGKVVWLVACLAYAGYGRRAQFSSLQQDSPLWKGFVSPPSSPASKKPRPPGWQDEHRHLIDVPDKTGQPKTGAFNQGANQTFWRRSPKTHKRRHERKGLLANLSNITKRRGKVKGLFTAVALWHAGKKLSKRARYLPVVLVHGIRSCTEAMETAAQWIRDALGNGIYVRSIEIGNGRSDSFKRPMEWQLLRLAEQIQADNKLAGGFNLIGYSQGSLLARAFVQRYDYPRVNVLVSWVGPQAGQFGVPEYEPLLKKVNHITSAMWYTKPIQETVSFSNYWRDPTRLQLYREKSAFLADINNERAVKNASYSTRIARLKHFVLLYSDCDKVIQPALSSWFSFFRDNSTNELVPLSESKLYTEDHIGLQKLDRAGRLHFARCHCSHQKVPTPDCKVEVFDRATRSFLKPERVVTAIMRWIRLHTRPPKHRFPLSEEERTVKRSKEALSEAQHFLEQERERVSQLLTELKNERKRAKKAMRQLQRTGGETKRHGLAVAADAWQAAKSSLRQCLPGGSREDD